MAVEGEQLVKYKKHLQVLISLGLPHPGKLTPNKMEGLVKYLKNNWIGAGIVRTRRREYRDKINLFLNKEVTIQHKKGMVIGIFAEAVGAPNEVTTMQSTVKGRGGHYNVKHTEPRAWVWKARVDVGTNRPEVHNLTELTAVKGASDAAENPYRRR